MILKLTLAYSPWLIPLCILLGLIYAFFLYLYRPEQEAYEERYWLPYLLFFLRTLVVALIAFFLLDPMLQYRHFEEEKPALLLAVDNSGSLKAAGGKNMSVEKLKTLETELSKKFDLEMVEIGEDIRPLRADSFNSSRQATNLSAVLHHASRFYTHRNLSATVILSDGIYNSGSNPSHLAANSRSAVYTVGLGDTTRHRDFGISNVLHNSIAYLGNEFPLRVELKASGLEGRPASIEVRVNGTRINSKNIVINADPYFFETDIIAKAIQLGPNRVDIHITEFDEEKNKSNNSYRFYIDVLDAKKKLEIWAAAPHPDIATFRSLILKNENYELDLYLGNNQKIKPETDLIILHNWFRTEAERSSYEKIRASGIPVLLVLGSRFDPALFNKSSQSLKFYPMGRGDNAAQIALNPTFEYFDIPEHWTSQIQNWSPLSVPFGRFSGFKSAEVLFFQKIGKLSTSEPLILLQEDNRYRMGLIAGTGLWQWKLLDYEHNMNHELSGELLNRMVQYLSVKDDKKLLKVYPAQTQVRPGSDAVLLGELYNQSLAGVANAEIMVEITDENSRTVKRVMQPFGTRYKLEVSNLKAGVYRYKALVTIGGLNLEDHGYFTVLEQQLENMYLEADHGLLRNISQQSGGQFYQSEELNELVDHLLQNESMSTLIKEKTKLSKLIQFKWIFWLLLTLLSLEWFSRKINGAY